MQEVFTQIFRLLILVSLQIFIFSEINLFGVAIAFPFLFFILFLPHKMPTWQVLLISFIVGFAIDFFVGTYGLYAAAATCVGLAKNKFLIASIRNYDEEEDQVNLSQLSITEFSKYILFASLLFCGVFFLLDYFSFSAFLRIIAQIIGSTIFTFLCIFSYRYIFVNQKT